ncbi:MAG: DEAD/DEAH box helicase [Planctomycetota bacterium]
MLVLHANWTERSLRLWAESLDRFLRDAEGPDAVHGIDGGGTAVASATVATLHHPYAATVDELRAALIHWLGDAVGSELLHGSRSAVTPLRLPRVAHVPSLELAPVLTLPALLRMETTEPVPAVEVGHDLTYWIVVGRFILELLASQRFVPTLAQSPDALQATWQPWLHDEAARTHVGLLLEAMPPLVRAVDDPIAGQPWPILSEAVSTLVDRSVRRALIAERYDEAIEDRERTDPHVAWLGGLLADSASLELPPDDGTMLLREVGRWIGALDETGRDQALRLCFRLQEPPDETADADASNESVWWLGLHLQGVNDPSIMIDAEQLWSGTGPTFRSSGLAASHPDELLLTELGRAARIYPKLETALEGAAPTGIELTTAEAYAFLCEFRPLLEESEFGVEVPGWWESSSSRLAALLSIRADAPSENVPGSGSDADRSLGLDRLVEYRWQVAVGDHTLTEDELEQLGATPAPLLRIHGQWIVLPREDLEAAQRLLQERPGGEATLRDAFQLAHPVDGTQAAGLPVGRIDATGWVGDLLSGADSLQMPRVKQPQRLQGELRPYQESGLSWLVFLDQLGLGACLADDMGLGKTVQLITLLQHERQEGSPGAIGPTLLLVPTSLIGNWTREIERFAPELRVHVQHGPDRPVGEHFATIVRDCDVVITTYGLVTRDLTTLDQLAWHRVALDEAQFIKNPPTKQTSSIRALRTGRRVALTGTPVENRLSELWSIMEFCNPGYLGTPGEFRRRFAVPIERHRDPDRASMLRELVRPFVLRRLKTDPNVIDDLPACLQTREYATLTSEQAAIYKRVVDGMLGRVEQAEGIQRRGLVLAALVRLKQVCDHPELLADNDPSGGATDIATLAPRSGKVQRLLTMLEEIHATGDRVLIFTQFRQMGHLLAAMIQHELDREVLFMHGGTPQARRQQMVDRFQDQDGRIFAFIASLRAGGVGLNLTAATHVFHFDRWWNPAVENQATDRAFRIGQTRTVHVHKFVCAGTLEERIDQMLEQKTELARNIIGSGEHWLSELSSEQLREVLTLRQSAMEGE